MTPWSRLLAALTVLSLLAVPAVAQVTPEDIAEAEAELARLRAETDQLAAEFEAALARSAQLEDQIAALEAMTQESQIRLAATRQLVRERAVEMYIESSTSHLNLLFVGGIDGGVEVGISYLEELGSSDTALLRDLEVIKTEYERQLTELDGAYAEQAEVLAALETVGAELAARLETAQSTYVALVEQRAAEERARREAEARRRAEEEARRAAEEAAQATTTTTAPTTTTTLAGETATTVEGETTTTVEGETSTTLAESTTTTSATTTTTAPPVPTGQTCPVNGFTSFTDTWGAPRSGGRSHQGVDMLGARGTPLVAIESGTVRRMRNGGLGGITVWLRGTSGDEFYYAHLDGWAPGLQVGQKVNVGDLLGYMGTSGNAPDYIPHLHFEYHPGGGSAVNPYPLVKGLCG